MPAKKRFYVAPGKYFYRLNAPDQFTNQTLKALRTKLMRDYLGFFDNLRKLYGASRQGKQVDTAIVETKKAVSLLDSVLSSGSMAKEDVENLTQHIETLNNQKEFFLEQSTKVAATRQRIEKVTKETGISPQDLNITKEMVVKGASRARRTAREGVVPFLRRTMPGVTAGVERGVKGVAGAFLGPFAPLAGMAGTALRDIYGLAGGIREKLQQRQERALGAQLRPMAMGAPAAAFERIQAARQRGMPVTSFGGFARRGAARRPSKEDMVAPLQYFFDKKAHRAKWTRDVLTKFKDIERSLSGKGLAGMLGLGGLGEKFGALGSAILPLIGKAGLIAAFAAGLGLSIKKFAELGKGLVDLKKAREAQAKAEQGLARATEQKKAALSSMGIEQYAAKVGKTPRQVAMDVAYQEQKTQLAEYRRRPWYKKFPGARRIFKGPEITPYYERVAEIEREYGSVSRTPGLPAGGGVTAGEGVSAEQMKELQKSIDNMSDEYRRTQGPQGIRSAGIGNPYDSGDALLNNLAEGTLTIE